MNVIEGVTPLMDFYDHRGYADLLLKLEDEYTRRELRVLAEKLGVGASPVLVANKIVDLANKRSRKDFN